MPELRNIIVHVTTADGRQLEEWGTQRLRRSNHITTYIQSESNLSFRVMVEPRIPYVAHDAPLAESSTQAAAQRWMTKGKGDEDEEDEESTSRSKQHRIDYFFPYEDSQDVKGHRSSSLQPPTLTELAREYRHRGSASLSPSSALRSAPAPGFDFIAKLFLDGRQKPEKSHFIYLDPDSEEYRHYDSGVQFKGRYVEGKDGKTRLHKWMFKDVGIETVFDRMLISGDQRASEELDEDALMRAMDSVGISGEKNTLRQEKCGLGKIVVTLRRVKLGSLCATPPWPRFKEGENDEINMKDADESITHTAGFKASKPVDFRVSRAWNTLNDEGIYATFTFFYRSKEQLQKFNFPGFPPAVKEQGPLRTKRRDRRLLNEELSVITPLSISKPMTKARTRTKKGEAYEDKVKSGNFKSEKKVYDFGEKFRECSNHDVLVGRAISAPAPEQRRLPKSSRPWSAAELEDNVATPSTAGESVSEAETEDGGTYTTRGQSLQADESASASASPSLARGAGKAKPFRISSEHAGADSSHSRMKLLWRPETDLERFSQGPIRVCVDNDADDELSGSDMASGKAGINTTSDSEENDDDLDDDNKENTNVDQDDMGLHSDLDKFRLGKRDRVDEDGEGGDGGKANDADSEAETEKEMDLETGVHSSPVRADEPEIHTGDVGRQGNRAILSEISVPIHEADREDDAAPSSAMIVHQPATQGHVSKRVKFPKDDDINTTRQQEQ